MNLAVFEYHTAACKEKLEKAVTNGMHCMRCQLGQQNEVWNLSGMQ